ncbi:thiolase domain-containing protein [Devosia sp. YIM 151766]|uniref:thiolase domain-containing protein n=1 Tax=Devosia sp. YIM 151766 TaxID=3017325 RepID=UPI00255CD24F|nr:thiolase domain-containing protein [Devosia sp. YIM 151766]WIY53171.1 thiolase domain-containing protein [Devosia sp. YIM 151766]
MSRTSGSAYIVGAFEHPARLLPDRTVPEIHAEVALGALRDAGLDASDIDGFFCAGDAPGLGPISMVEYLNLQPRYVDSTDLGGCSYVAHVARAASAIAAGECSVALITLAGRPRSEGKSVGTATRVHNPLQPDLAWEIPYRPALVAGYAMAAHRHMHEFGTTDVQLAWVKAAFSRHAQHNPHAMLPAPVSVDDVLNSPMIADPLHRLDCCVVTDGGGALIVARPEIAARLNRPKVRVLAGAHAIKHQNAGAVDLTTTAAAQSAPRAFAQAGVEPGDIKYASLYDSFTITVLLQLEDLGFCRRGEGGRFAADGGLISGTGRLAVNTDGGGLCNNHPGNRGGMTKVIEAVRQLRGEAHPAVQVRNCDLALAQGIGGNIGTRHGAATLILERE